MLELLIESVLAELTVNILSSTNSYIDVFLRVEVYQGLADEFCVAGLILGQEADALCRYTQDIPTWAS